MVTEVKGTAAAAVEILLVMVDKIGRAYDELTSIIIYVFINVFNWWSRQATA